jgi:choline-glycine betaine transporter
VHAYIGTEPNVLSGVGDMKTSVGTISEIVSISLSAAGSAVEVKGSGAAARSTLTCAEWTVMDWAWQVSRAPNVGMYEAMQ